MTGEYVADLQSRRGWVSRSGWIVGSQVIGAASALGVTVALGRVAGPRALGTYAAISAASTLAVAIGSFQLEAHIAARLSGRAEDAAVVVAAMRAAYAITLPLVLVASTGVLAVMDAGVVRTVALVMIVEVLVAPLLLTRTYLHAHGRQRSIAVATGFGRISWIFMASCIFIMAPETALLGAIGFRLIGTIIEVFLLARAVGFSVAGGLVGGSGFADIPTVWITLREASPLAVSGTATAANQRVDVLLLTALLGANASGIYGAATRLAEPFRLIGSAIYQVVTPALVQASSEGRRHATAAIARDFSLLLGVVTGLAAATLAAVAPFVVPALFGHEFVRAVEIVPLLVVAEMCLLVGLVSTSIALAVGRRSSIAWSACAAATVNLSANLVLVPHYGIGGAAVASFGSYAISGFAVLILDSYVRAVGKSALWVSVGCVALTITSISAPMALGWSALFAPAFFIVGWLVAFRKDAARALVHS